MTSRRRLFGEFLKFYNDILNKHKYPVQIVTGGALWFTGDVICQSLVQTADYFQSGHKQLPEKKDSQPPSGREIINETRKWPGIQFDWQRVGRMTLYGVFVSAPVYAFWYSYLDRWSHRVFARRVLGAGGGSGGVNSEVVIIPAPLRHLIQRFPRSGQLIRSPLLKLLKKMPEPGTRRVWEIIGFKLAADCFLFDPLYLALFFSSTNALEGRRPAEIAQKLREDLLPTYLVDISVWLPIQTVNFRWIPVNYQAIFVQSCNIGWNAYLSFVQHRH